MRIINRFISAGFKLIYLAGAIYGVLLNLFAPGVEVWSVLSFYTMQSNLFCIALTLVLLACDLTDIDYHENRLYTTLRYCALVSILLAFTIYHAVLEPRMSAEYPAYFSGFSVLDALIHTYTPVMLVLDYLLFDEKGLFRWWYAPLAAAVPLLYAAYLAVYSATGGVFVMFNQVQNASYFFLDYQALGRSRIALWVSSIVGGTVIGAFVLIALDHALRRLWDAHRAWDSREKKAGSTAGEPD